MMKCEICQEGSLSPLPGDFYDYLSKKKFEVWQCNQCFCKKTVGDISEDFYGEAYYGSSEGKFSPVIEKLFLYNHRRNARNFYKRFKPESVLEIGCGRGYLLREFRNLGCIVTGLESVRSPDWILENQEIPVHAIHNSDKWPFEDNSQDLVIIWHVLEHTQDPEYVLKEIRRVLAPGGSLCISVPNCDSIQSQLKLAQWFHLDLPRHLYHYNSKGLIKQLNNLNYEVLEERSGDLTQNIYGWWQTLCNLLTPNDNNLLYRFIQGGRPWKTTSNKSKIYIHLIALPIVMPLGIIAWVVEEVFNRPGSITLYVSKKSNRGS